MQSKNDSKMACREMTATEVDVAIFVALAKLAHVRVEGADMQRDMELVREILRTIQAKADLTPREITVDGYDPEVVGRHIEILYRDGYIEGPSFSGGRNYLTVLVKDLTGAGHDLAGVTLTEESVWQKVKAGIGPEKLATWPIKFIEKVATDAMMAWAKGQLGL